MRKTKIASCSVPEFVLGQDKSDSVARRTLQLVDQAGQRGADIVCMPEYAAASWDSSVGDPILDASGPSLLDSFAELAAKHRMYVLVAGIEANASGGKPFNTVFVFDRAGSLIGKYRKTHLCLPGFQEGLRFAAGDELPVFATDFGSIGVVICMDIHYPEIFTTLALRGAEIIFWPTAAMDYTGDLIESLVNARAIDNQVFMVPSHYIASPYLAGKSYGRGRVVDPMGRIRADTGHFAGVAIAEVDLDETYPMWYSGEMRRMYPDMRQTLFKTRRPELYGELTRPRLERDWKR